MKKFITVSMVAVLLFLGMIPAFADAAAWDEKPVDYYVYVSTPDGGLNFRHGPGVEYAKVFEERIPDGVKLHIVTESGDWGMTKYNGYYGWVALKQTTKAQPTTKPVATTVETTTQVEETAAVTENTTESTMLATTATTEAINNTETDNSNAGNMMFLLIGVILVLVVVIAVLLIFIVNKKK